jgi:hypothetical protein
MPKTQIVLDMGYTLYNFIPLDLFGKNYGKEE